MLKRKLYHRLLVLSIVGSITVTSGIIAFADSAKVTNTPKSKIEGKLDVHPRGGDFKGDIEKVGMQKDNFLANTLTTEVKAGVITQAEADKVIAFLKTKEAARKVERDAEKAKLEAMTDAEKKVSMEAKKAEKVAEKAKLKAMTTEEKTAYMKANKSNKVNIFTELVTAKILTQDQATKIEAAMPQRYDKGQEMKNQQGPNGPKFGNQSGKFLTSVLTTQVKAGVITQVEADKVTAFLKTKEEAMKAKMDAEKAKLEAMTTEERTAYMKANRPNNVSIFTELVTTGILTKEQADKIQAAAPQNMKRDENRKDNKGKNL
jgi:hypothetical protein